MRSYGLSKDERDRIGVSGAAGRSMGAIARALGRRNHHLPELQANALPLGRYSAASRRRSLSIAQAA